MNGVDDIFRDYFRREVPRTLPPLPLNTPATAAAPVPRGNTFLMAASVAALLGVGLWLSGLPRTAKPQPAQNSYLNGATADGEKILKTMNEKK